MDNRRHQGFEKMDVIKAKDAMDGVIIYTDTGKYKAPDQKLSILEAGGVVILDAGSGEWPESIKITHTGGEEQKIRTGTKDAQILAIARIRWMHGNGYMQDIPGAQENSLYELPDRAMVNKITAAFFRDAEKIKRG